MPDFQQVLQNPTATFEEGLRFFNGSGLVNQTLKQLARDLEERGIDYAVIGAIALNQHGYKRFTSDIDVLLTKNGLQKFQNELVGRGYRPAFPGATRKFRATSENVPIEIITSGEFPGDGKPKAVVFPDPTEVRVEIDGIQTVALETLVELKLASGSSDLGRLKDLADVQELIRVLNLEAAFSDRLNASVRAVYLQLRDALENSRQNSEAPDAERE